MKILIVVDMQNDFINVKGALPIQQDEALTNKMISNIDKKIREYLEDKENYIFFTQDTHSLGSEMQNKYIEMKQLPAHCLVDTWGWEIIGKLRGYANHFNTVWKSTFGAKALINRIKEFKEEVDSIELVGVCTDICVLSNAIMLRNAFPAIPIKVCASCCAGTRVENHEAACRVLEMNCIEVSQENCVLISKEND